MSSVTDVVADDRSTEEDEMLLALCHYCFVHEKYDEVILAYLLRYYDGPVESMKELWLAGKDFEADTFVLEEKNPYHGDVYQERGRTYGGDI